jgi:ribosomal protein S12 methylthiotransferase accessory factor
VGVTRVADVTGFDRIGAPVAQAIRPQARSIAVAMGKGTTLAAARASAMMEAIEGSHAERVALPRLTRRFGDLHPSRGCLDAADLVAAEGARAAADAPVVCVEGEDLLSGRRFLTPLDTVETDYSRPPESRLFHASSNGLAAGSTPDEATLSALTELAERDALADWGRLAPQARAARRIDPSSIPESPAAAWIEAAARAGIGAALWDAANDLGAPVILCRFWAPGFPAPTLARPCFGAGCHPRREVALTRAVAEAAQARLVRILGARDDISETLYAPLSDAETLAGLMPQDRGGRPFDDAADWGDAPVEAQIAALLARFAACGVETALRVDLTRATVGVPVMRLVAPGLGAPVGHDRFAPGTRRRARSAGGWGA